MRRLVASLSIALLAGFPAGCNEATPAAPAAVGGSAAAKPGGGGFSADLAKEFASASGSGDGKAGSGGAAPAGSGDGKAGDGKAGDGKAGDGKAGDGKAGDGKAGDGKAGDGKAGDGKTDDGKAGDGKAGDGKAGDGKAGDGKGSDQKVAEGKDARVVPDALRTGTGPGPVIQSSGAQPKRAPVPAELAAIKFGMLPNWDRDAQSPGTLSLAVKIPGRTESAVFVFRYGYEDASAPADRDAYKKWLGDKRILTVRQDRQANSTWYLEGSDGSGNPAFRFAVGWGGKKLICYGSLYRDPESSKLGDLRDQTVIQAKQICETISL